MPLTYLPDRNLFVLGCNTKALSDVDWRVTAGLDFHRDLALSRGFPVYSTNCPYAALQFWSIADDVAQEALAEQHAALEESNATTSDYDPPVPWGQRLLPFQKAGVEYAVERRHSVIGDAPGLGKTIQAIVLANALGARRVLVVCPASLRPHWRRMVRRWSTQPNVRAEMVRTSRDGISPTAHYIIISYDLVRHEGLHAAICRADWDLLVLDEVHFLKTPEARRTRALFGGGTGIYKTRWISQSARRIVGLTGTPLPNRPREFYTVVRALCHDAIDWISYDKFQYRFNPSGTWREETGRLPELYARLRCNLMVRRLKEDVLKDLPPKRYELAYVEENGAIKKVLRMERLLDVSIGDLDKPWQKIDGQISTIRRLMGEAKVPRIVEHLITLLDGGVEKVVVFAHHRSVIAAVATSLEKYGVVLMQGGMTPIAKEQAIDAFVEGKPRIFLAQINVGGVGIDGLQHVASHVVFAEASWVPGDNEQAVDRLHRHGQNEGVLAQFLVAPDSLDERILGAVIEKNHTINATLDRI